MGYTHYWTFKKSKLKAADKEKAYQKATKDIHKVVLYAKKNVVNLSGYTAHSKIGQYGGIDFNGVQEYGHENFYLREHFNQNEGFNFCKTAQKDYDIVVVAALIILKHRLKDAIQVESDGDYSAWFPALELVKKVLGLKGIKIPNTIERRAYIRVPSLDHNIILYKEGADIGCQTMTKEELLGVCKAIKIYYEGGLND